MQLNDIKKLTKSLTVEFGDEVSLNIEYRPSFIGSTEAIKFTEEMTGTKDIHLQREAMSKMFVSVVAWWDLYDGETPVPLSVESVKDLPMSILSKIFSCITEDTTK